MLYDVSRTAVLNFGSFNTPKVIVFIGRTFIGKTYLLAYVSDLKRFLRIVVVLFPVLVDELNDFLMHLHAPERNAHINTLREPGKPGSVKYKDKGS